MKEFTFKYLIIVYNALIWWCEYFCTEKQ